MQLLSSPLFRFLAPPSPMCPLLPTHNGIAPSPPPCVCMLTCVHATDCSVSQASGVTISRTSCCESSSSFDLACRSPLARYDPPLCPLRTHEPGAHMAPGSFSTATTPISFICSMRCHTAAILERMWHAFIFVPVGASNGRRRVA